MPEHRRRPALRWIALAATAALAAVAALAWRSPLTLINALVPSASYRLQPGLPYGPLARQRLDVYTPIRAARARGWPMVVFFYGGSWNHGERADYRFVAEAMAARGVLVIVADYRLYPEVRYPSFLEDSAQALAWGLAHAKALGADLSRVFVMGHSAGAYNAAMLALDARWLAAAGHAPHELAGWIGLAGPYEFLPMTDREAQPVFFHPDYPPGTQPIDYASSNAPPSFLGAAIDDTLVNPQRSTLAMAARLRSAGVPVTLKMYSSVGHASLIGSFAWPLRGLAPVLDDVVAFIEAPQGAASAAKP